MSVGGPPAKVPTNKEMGSRNESMGFNEARDTSNSSVDTHDKSILTKLKDAVSGHRKQSDAKSQDPSTGDVDSGGMPAGNIDSRAWKRGSASSEGTGARRSSIGGVLDELKPGGRGLDDPDQNKNMTSTGLGDILTDNMPSISGSLSKHGTGDPGSLTRRT